MNVSATGTSSLTALYYQQLLGASGTSSSGTAATDAAGSDLLTLSDAGQAASQGTDPFQTDLQSLDSAISSRDLATARKQYEAMAEKMKQNGQVPSDFAAIGTALDAGDLTSAASAVSAVEQKASSHRAHGHGGANPLQQDMDQLGGLLQSGDTTDAQTLFSSILSKLQGGTGTAADSTSTTTSPSSGTSSTDAGSSSGNGSLSSYLDALDKALSSGDTSTALSAYENLMSQLQSGAGGASGSLARSMGSLAASAYATSAVTL